MSRDKVSLVLGAVLLLAVLADCGKKEPAAPDSQKAATADTVGPSRLIAGKGLSPDALAIQEALNSAQVRLHYGDKSGLYDNEYEYLTDETSFDEYLAMPQIQAAKADSLEYIEVTKVELRGENSAMVDVVVHFLGATGVRHEFADKVRMFRHKGRWIRPTVSLLDHQLEYENIVRQADSAAEAEARGR